MPSRDQRHLAPWSRFKVEGAAKFLGFYVGPECGKFNWNGPLGKLQDRVKQIKSAAAPVHINAYHYNTRVCPVMSYQAQLLPLDKHHFLLERIALHAVYQAPFNTFRHSDFFQLSQFGASKLRSFNVDSAAALFRTAAR